MLVTFEPLLRFYFYKMLDRSELNFLLIDHLSTCLPVTTRQTSTTWWFCQNWLVLELPEFFGKKWPFLVFYTPHSPQCIGMRTISPNFFFWLLLFFMLDHDILTHCASYKCMNKGDFIYFQWEISINRWETMEISEKACLPRNMKFW